MEFMNAIVLANASLPTLDGIENWGLQVIQQAILLIVVFLVTKHLAKFKVGAIIISCVVGGAVYFVVRNWSTVSGWVEAFINTL